MADRKERIFNKYNLLKCISGLLVFLYSSYSIAIGLDNLTVHSYLNELLDAEIALTGAEDLETSNIIAGIASRQDFMRAGIPRPGFLSDLRFETIRRNNSAIIKIYTKKIVKDPFIDFLIELVWPDGKIIKGYTILLDPKPDLTTQQPGSDPNEVAAPTFGDISKNQSKESVLITSLEESIENEALGSSIGSNKYKDLNNSTDLMFATTEPNQPKPSQPQQRQSQPQQPADLINTPAPDPGKEVLNRVVSSLQVFVANSKLPKINYEKLLDFKPNPLPTSPNGEQLVENIAMRQINSELNSLRSRDSDSGVKSPTQPVANVVNNTKYLELIKTYGNDLLWACFLVSTTIFLFYKTIHSEQSVQLNEELPQVSQQVQVPQQSSEQLSQQSAYNYLSQDQQQIPQSNPAAAQSVSSSNLIGVKDQEVELKISLAKQYISAGDQQSAKDLLQSININTQSSYNDQVSLLLKSVM